MNDALSIQRPSLALLGAEPFRAAIEFASHKFRKSVDAKPGDGHPVVIFPGLGASRKSVATSRAHCRSLGYVAFDRGQGFNTGPQGDLDAWLHTLKSQVVDLLAGHTQAVTLIGWSLGGLYPREVGKPMATRIRQVITISTPFNAQVHHTNVGWLFRLLSGSSSTLAPAHSPTVAHDLDLQPVGRCRCMAKTCRHEKRSSRVHDIAKSAAATSAWAGTETCLRRLPTGSVSQPGHGAAMCARDEAAARRASRASRAGSNGFTTPTCIARPGPARQCVLSTPTGCAQPTPRGGSSKVAKPHLLKSTPRAGLRPARPPRGFKQSGKATFA